MKKLQNNFTTPEQSKRLLELGVPADSSDFYFDRDEVEIDEAVQPYFIPFNRKFSNYNERFYIPCWSVGRLIEIYEICFGGYFNSRYFGYTLMKDVLLKIEEQIDSINFSKLEEGVMTEQEIIQSAEVYADSMKEIRGELEWCATRDDFTAGAHSRDEEIEMLKRVIEERQLEIERLRNPWITDDRYPEIKGSISDAVLLLIDGMFYKVSRLERRKDGTEFWWGVHPEDGDEVDAWMPIPQIEKGV